MSEWEKRLGCHPAELVNPSDLPKDHPVRYQKEAAERGDRFMELLESISARLDDLTKRVAAVEAREYQININTPETPPATVIVKASDVNIPAPQVVVNPTFKNTMPEIKPETFVIQAPEKKLARTGTMKKNKDGSFEFTVEDK